VKAKLDFDANNKPGIPALSARSDQYAAALGVAVANLESARLRLVRLQAPPNKNSLAAASAGIAQAQANLNKIKSGPEEITVLSAQAQIDQARLSLNRAIQRRDDTVIRAPFTGLVSVVNVKVGALPPAGQPALVMIDSSHLHVEVNVDELDIGRIGIGQPVRVVFDAMPGEVILGQVTSIASVASTNAGVVSYSTRIDLEQTDLLIRSGMTATADIIVQRVEGILVVPNWAVRFDRESGQAFASVPVENNQLREVPVLLGIRGEIQSQVLAGLQNGDPVAVKLQPGELSFEPGGDGDQ
jgi:HlyD family secretion protein